MFEGKCPIRVNLSGKRGGNAHQGHILSLPFLIDITCMIITVHARFPRQLRLVHAPDILEPSRAVLCTPARLPRRAPQMLLSSPCTLPKASLTV